MPKDDDHVCRCSAMQIAQAICFVMAGLGTLCCSVIAAYYSAANNSRGESMEQKQDAEHRQTKKIESLLYVPPDQRAKLMPPESNEEAKK